MSKQTDGDDGAFMYGEQLRPTQDDVQYNRVQRIRWLTTSSLPTTTSPLPTLIANETFSVHLIAATTNYLTHDPHNDQYRTYVVFFLLPSSTSARRVLVRLLTYSFCGCLI
jgi:hypothetical protein